MASENRTRVVDYLYSADDLRHQLLGIAYVLVMMLCLDLLVCRKLRARWMALHFCGNVVVVASSLNDVISAMDNPITSCVGRSSSELPTHVIIALHAYHLALFECSMSDVVHHVIFVGIIGSVGICFDMGGPLKNLIAFFICGLPGGLDYLMLTLVKQDLMLPVTEKTWNSRINVWIRSPGLLLCAFCVYQAVRHGPANSACAIQPHIAGFLATLLVINGQYYMQRVTGNTYRKVQQFSS
ncbi:hypothetical protein AB1Y20_006984 [Prymnesium parvum]|uniref:Peptidase S54 rhomboid domain-containing protein n=1 Tax=Prymnesium parvum TaxID=97485 RepID=A0AB34J1X9_PRYPA